MIDRQTGAAAAAESWVREVEANLDRVTTRLTEARVDAEPRLLEFCMKGGGTARLYISCIIR
jgi:hypothetical protein